MIGRVSKFRHAIVLAAVAGTTTLAGLGVIADPDAGRDERFDAKTVVVARQGDEAIRITEYVDIDFGGNDRRGYRRVIPNDFGAPTDVVASSPDAADDLTVIPLGGETEIRIGDPDRTWDGQHRYVLSYTLPDAMYDRFPDPPFLFVDIVAPRTGTSPGDAETGRFEVVVTGYELATTRCDVGGPGEEGGCELDAAGDGTYRTVLEPLAAGTGLSVGGRIEGFAEPVTIEPPPIPDRRGEPNRLLVAVGFAVLGLAGAVPVYLWARHTGRNEVFSGGAADAAYGSLPPPGSPTASPAVRWVPDDDMAELATIEFVPPEGIEPWEASVLLRERVDDETVQAWLSGLVGREAVEVAESGRNLELSSGPRRGELGAPDAGLLAAILDIDDPYTTGTYDRRFAAAWSAVQRAQVERVAHSGWWKHLPPGAGLGVRTSGSPFGLIMIAVFALFWAGSGFVALLGALAAWPFAIAIGLLFPAVVAFFVYRVLLPARSASGSALALRTESFRRFLHASEARHVEWAWSNGLLREYSAWAVALGEADAWSRALARANVPEPARLAAVPMAVHTFGPSLSSSRTAPSSSGSGGGGGFSGGGVGGGGGGGSSGSW